MDDLLRSPPRKKSAKDEILGSCQDEAIVISDGGSESDLEVLCEESVSSPGHSEERSVFSVCFVICSCMCHCVPENVNCYRHAVMRLDNEIDFVLP